MKIKQDPITKLWCREGGAILMPPSGRKFKKFRWAYGCINGWGYRQIRYLNKIYLVHRIICRAFRGLPPADKPEVDHIDRDPLNNREDNLRWADRSINMTNRSCVDRSIEKYGVRFCDDPKAYCRVHDRGYKEAHREEIRAYDAARRAEKKAQGLSYRKGPDGKKGWYPKINTPKQKGEQL